MLLALHLFTFALEPRVLTHWKLIKGDSCALHQSDVATGVSVYSVFLFWSQTPALD